MAEYAIRLDAAPAIEAFSALAEAAESLRQAIEASAEIVRCFLRAAEIARVLQDERDLLTATRAGDGVLRLEPSQRFLELAAALRAVALDLRGAEVERHGESSSGSVASPCMEGGGSDSQRVRPAASNAPAEAPAAAHDAAPSCDHTAAEHAIADRLHRWHECQHGVLRSDLSFTQIEVLRDGADRILVVLRDGRQTFRARFDGAAAARLAALLAPDAQPQQAEANDPAEAR